jgi:hypothetical protein
LRDVTVVVVPLLVVVVVVGPLLPHALRMIARMIPATRPDLRIHDFINLLLPVSVVIHV